MEPVDGQPPCAFYLVVQIGKNETGHWVAPEELGRYQLEGLDFKMLADYLLPIIAMEKMYDSKLCLDKWGHLLSRFEEAGLLDKQY